jgi:nitrite reductase/ring-hydroxylating ferredoxin subunit/putative sterol carrier protein
MYRRIVGARFPFPSFPHGWYVIAFSSDIAPGEVRTVHYFGDDIVLFRGQSGVVQALDKTCPHLGAHLGGGHVEDDCLRCPFHAWRFDASGRCVEVPYAPKVPPKARVRTWPTAEQNGCVFVYHGAEVAPWSLPTWPTDGWTADRRIKWEIRSHPQEVAENTVDCAHLAPVHHVTSTTVSKVEQNDHVMRVVLDLVASGEAIGMPDEINDVELDVTLHGLGCVVSRTHVKTAGLLARQRIHSTPIDRERIAIFALASIEHMADPDYTREMDDIFWDAFIADFPRDFPIWENKAYLERPMLAGGDGPIPAYRRWARQFYAAPAAGEKQEAAKMRAVSALPGLDRLRGRLSQLRHAAQTWLSPPREAVPPPATPMRRDATATATAPKFATVDAYFDTLEHRFDPEAAGELQAVFQWSLSGERRYECFAEVRGGSVQTSTGVHRDPTVTIEMSIDDYLRMINGELNGAMAFSTGRGRLRGPVRLAMKMRKLFPLEREV